MAVPNLPALATNRGRFYLCRMEIEATFICVYCLQVNEIVVDGTGGVRQEYIEDCQVCCRPNNLIITVNEEMQEASIEPEQL